MTISIKCRCRFL